MNFDLIIGMVLGAMGVLGLTLVGAALGKTVEKIHEKKAAQKPAPPRAIDPKNPPKYAVYVRDADDPEEVCTCHGRPLKDSETILVWPGPPERLCEETYKMAPVL